MSNLHQTPLHFLFLLICSLVSSLPLAGYGDLHSVYVASSKGDEIDSHFGKEGEPLTELHRVKNTTVFLEVESNVLRAVLASDSASRKLVVNTEPHPTLPNQALINLANLMQVDETFPIGTQWTYEYFPEQFSPNERPVSFITYEVVDTTRRGDTLVYTLDNNRDRPVDFFYEQDDKIYFEEEFGWALHYDFLANVSYPIVIDSTRQTTASIDSINETFWLGDRGSQRLQFLKYPEYGDASIPPSIRNIEVLNGVGKLSGGPKLPLFTLADFSSSIGKLRCFTSGDFFWNFDESLEPIACDSSYVEILNNVTTTVEDLHFTVYPNPTMNEIMVATKSRNLRFSLFDTRGKIITTGILDGSPLQLPRAGVFYLTVTDSRVARTLKLVRY